MLSSGEFDNWAQHLELSKEAKSLIQQIRNSSPVRAVNSSKSNVSGRYPSRKMGVTIQFESHKNELAFIYEYEHNNQVLEYFDQPSTIKLNYESANGRHLGVLHTPDFFIIHPHAAGWQECKTEEQLVKLSSKNPNRYVQDADGKWRSPAGEEYADKLGLYYQLRSSKEINWTFQRNVEFFDDYFRINSPSVATDICACLLSQVAAKPGITLAELFDSIDGTSSRDTIFLLIAHNALYVDLCSAPMVEPEKVSVFSNYDTAIAYRNVVQTPVEFTTNISPFIDLAVGSLIQWDGKGWMIVNVGETMIGLLGEHKMFTELPITVLENLVRENRITGITHCSSQGLHPEAKKRLEQANKHICAKANYQFQIVQAHLRDDPLPENVRISERTLRRWIAKYRASKKVYGSGYIGLLPQKRRGNTNNKLPAQTQVLMKEFIENDYETLKQKSKSAVYCSFRSFCQDRGILPASYKTFCKEVKLRSRYKQTLKRKGDKAAYNDKEFYWELAQTIPRHGERPFHIGHVDHTELDEELVCSQTGKNLGRAWATFLMDAFSRRILAVYVTYDPPSYRSCMMVVRECVRRFGRLPQNVIVDMALEFSGTYLETLLAIYECTKKTRPSAQSRFGSVGERLFGTVHTQYIYNLQGNTQIMRNVRQVTKSVNPKTLAIWILEKHYLYLREWAYEVYDTIEHPALGQSPRDAFARGMINAGERTDRLITYNEQFRMLTLPTTKKTTAKVQPGRGVKINYIYYWADAFRHPGVEGTQVEVRFDPWNAGLSFAYVRGQWVECRSELHWVFHNRSEREIMLATEEMRRRRARHSGQFNITAVKLAKFLESIEAEEVLLRQRMADRETRTVLALIDSDLKSQRVEETSSTTIPEHDAPSLKQLSTSPLNESKGKEAENLELYGEF